jgi:hypothetical protein
MVTEGTWGRVKPRAGNGAEEDASGDVSVRLVVWNAPKVGRRFVMNNKNLIMAGVAMLAVVTAVGLVRSYSGSQMEKFSRTQVSEVTTPIEIRTFPAIIPSYIGNGGYTGTTGIEIISTTNNIVIQDVEVNRSNCRVATSMFVVKPDLVDNSHSEVKQHFMQGDYPFSLKYGEAKELGYSTCKEILEVKIRTDKGEFRFDTR